MRPSKLSLGNRAEGLAASYLVEKGLVFVDRNVRTRSGEIDLVMKDGECTVICEVRAKSETSHGEPVEAVNYKKQQKVLRMAKWYLARFGLLDSDCRIDVVGVTLSDPPVVTWIKNAITDD